MMLGLCRSLLKYFISVFNGALTLWFGRAAWAKVNGVDGDSKIKFMCDKEQYSKKIDWMAGMGDRNARWAMIIEKDGTISYAEQEQDPRKVTVRSIPVHSL